MKKCYLILLTMTIITTALANPPLRVCTTGDYPPLTYYNVKTHHYQGYAIEVARAFAKSIKRPIVFIPTTWKGLSHDLNAKCDIAVGGITRTRKRMSHFFVSDNILPNWKVPIFSRNNEKYFNNFHDIDQKGVIILENKGGTNEIYAKNNIKKAKIIILQSNAQVYACLNQYPQRKYVMLTDALEVNYRAGHILSDKGLKFKDMPNDKLQSKVYLIPKTKAGAKLKHQFNKFYQENQQEFHQWYKKALASYYPTNAGVCPL